MVVVKKDQNIFKKILQFFMDFFNIIILFFTSLIGMGDNRAADYGSRVSGNGTGGIGGGKLFFFFRNSKNVIGSASRGGYDNGTQRRFPNVRGVGGGGSGTTSDFSNCVSGGCGGG